MKITYLKFPFLASLLALLLSFSFLNCTGNKGKLKALTNSINSAVPLNIGDGFILMKASVVGNDELVLSFRMHGAQHTAFSEVERKYQEIRILDNLHNNPSTTLLRDLGATITYRVEDEKGDQIDSFTFTCEKYENFDADDYQLTELELKGLVEQMNAPLPTEIDEYTKLLEIQYLTPRTLEYSFELSEEVTSRPADEIKKLNEAIAASLKTAPQLHFLRIQKCNFINVYYSKDKKEFSRIEVLYGNYK